MKIEQNLFFFLSYYIPLPLSALKFIIEDKNHPFRKINELNKNEIAKQLKILDKKTGVSIKNIEKKVSTILNLLKQNILIKIEESLEYWKNEKIKFVNYFDKNYPKFLKVIKNPPKIVFYKGPIELIYKKAVSIVGTRKPTDYGLLMAFNISKRFSELGFTIVNGFARGIDTEAIRGAIEVGGKIIGVLGSGLLNPYPKANLKLFEDLIKNDKGLFISERLPSASITKSSLASRNRISSGLSLANVIIEAGENSGTRWQVASGKEQGKPIIVLKPQSYSEQAYLPNFIIENEKDCFIIENIKDIDDIVDSILKINKINKKDNKDINNKYQKSLTDF